MTLCLSYNNIRNWDLHTVCRRMVAPSTYCLLEAEADFRKNSGDAKVWKELSWNTPQNGRMNSRKLACNCRAVHA